MSANTIHDNHSTRPNLQQAVVGPRYLLIRTIKTMRNNVLFFVIYFGCTIVMWRALTGAGYVEGQEVSHAPRGSSLISRFESTFFLDTQRRAREAAGRRIEALRNGRKFPQSGKADTNAEVASDDIIGRLIFGEPSSANIARSTATNVGTSIGGGIGN